MIQNEKRPTVALKGRNVTLECICNKKECIEDSAVAYWKFRGRYVNQSERMRLSKMVTDSGAKIIMTIFNVSQIKEGQYLCGINTSLGFQERQRQLHVLTKGIIFQLLESTTLITIHWKIHPIFSAINNSLRNLKIRLQVGGCVQIRLLNFKPATFPNNYRPSS